MNRPMKVTVKVAKKETRELPIVTENIRLDAALKLANIVSTGGQAKMLIQDGLIKVGGEVCTMRGKKLFPGDSFEFERIIYNIVEK